MRCVTAALVALVLVMTGCASAPPDDPLRKVMDIAFIGEGASLEEARNAALTRAVEYAIGILVVSERTSDNGELKKRQILTHSAGYVEHYDIVSTKVVNYRHFVTLKAKVSSVKIAGVLKGTLNAQNISGQKIQDTLDTYQKQLESAERLLAGHLAKATESLYEIRQRDYRFQVNNRRESVLTMPFNVKLSANYLSDLEQLAKATSLGSARGAHYSVTFFDFFVGDSYFYSDEALFNKFSIVEGINCVRVQFLDKNAQVLETGDWRVFDWNSDLIAGRQSNTLTFRRSASVDKQIEMVIPQDRIARGFLRNLTRIQMKMARCQ